MDDYIEDDDYGHNKDAVCFAFTLHEREENNFELELFFNDAVVLDYRSIPDQNDPAASVSQMIPQVRQYAYYSYYGFGYLQNWAANAILGHVSGDPDAMIAAMTAPLKQQPIVADKFIALCYLVLPYFTMLMFIPMVYRVSYRVVLEKELRTKEYMKMMGMKTFPYWLSWVFFFTFVNTVISLFAVVILGALVLKYTSTFVIWLMYWMYG